MAMHSQIVVNPHFHRGTKIGKGGPVLAAKIGLGEFFFGQTFDLEIFAWINFVWIIENK